VVIIAAAKMGGILANDTYRYDFLAQNLAIELNLIEACRLARVPRVLFWVHHASIPNTASQSLREEYLLTVPLEQTNAPYALSQDRWGAEDLQSSVRHGLEVSYADQLVRTGRQLRSSW